MKFQVVVGTKDFKFIFRKKFVSPLRLGTSKRRWSEAGERNTHNQVVSGFQAACVGRVVQELGHIHLCLWDEGNVKPSFKNRVQTLSRPKVPHFRGLGLLDGFTAFRTKYFQQCRIFHFLKVGCYLRIIKKIREKKKNIY